MYAGRVPSPSFCYCVFDICPFALPSIWQVALPSDAAVLRFLEEIASKGRLVFPGAVSLFIDG